jgi:hypothetical protein
MQFVKPALTLLWHCVNPERNDRTLGDVARRALGWFCLSCTLVIVLQQAGALTELYHQKIKMHLDAKLDFAQHCPHQGNNMAFIEECIRLDIVRQMSPVQSTWIHFTTVYLPSCVWAMRDAVFTQWPYSVAVLLVLLTLALWVPKLLGIGKDKTRKWLDKMRKKQTQAQQKAALQQLISGVVQQPTDDLLSSFLQQKKKQSGVF